MDLRNRYLAKAFAGKSDRANVIVATLLTWGFYLFLGGIPLICLLLFCIISDPSKMEALIGNPFDTSLLPAFPMFIAIMLSFVIGMGGLYLGLHRIQKRSIKTILTGFAQVRWTRMLAGLGLWMLLSGAGTLYNVWAFPGSVAINPDAGQLIWFLPFALVLIPLQSAFEEMAIRGQLLQNFGRIFSHPMIPLLLTSLIFALLHGLNNEVAEFGFFSMMLFYFSFGFCLGAIALMDEGLELPIGIHVGNNLFAFLFVTYPGAAIETPSIFIMNTLDTGDMWQFYVSVVAVLFVFFRNRKNIWRALWKNEPIKPY